MPDLARKDYYGVLRLPHGASDPVIRQRFKRLAKRFHPDVNASPDAATQFRAIREAYEVLLDPTRRAVVDSWYVSHTSATPRRSAPVGARSPASAPGAATPVSTPAAVPQSRVTSSVWVAGGDRTWNFGCFALLSFVSIFLTSLSIVEHVSTALFVAAVAAVTVGSLAAIGGDRVRESLLWVFSWLWW